MSSGKTVTIAIEGCCHGELDNIYGALQHLEKVEGKKIDLLISCGDFQAVRNMDDLETMACPPKYRDIQSFYKYYSREKKPPFPTLFIGGNHEAANHLWELYYGGWSAPDIMFLGFTGCVKFGGLRIAGMSGIYKQHDYRKGHHERLPYDDSAMRSIYHIRDFEVYRLMQMQQPVDIFLTHDWPTNIAQYGDKDSLIKRKPFLAQEIASGELGNPPAEELLHALQPSYWFSAHLHTKFAAMVQHPKGNTTKFLALDKCLPGRDFLQVVELPATGPLQFEYDAEWLSILHSTHSLMNLNRPHKNLPGFGGLRKGPDPASVQHVERVLQERGSAVISNNFTPTAAAYDPKDGRRKGRMPMQHVRNPQTVALMEMLQLPYNLDHAAAQGMQHRQQQMVQNAPAAKNPEEIDLDDLGDEEPGSGPSSSQPPMKATGRRRGADRSTVVWETGAGLNSNANPEEIDLSGFAEASDEEGSAAKRQRLQQTHDANEIDLDAEDDDAPPSDGDECQRNQVEGDEAVQRKDSMFEEL